MRNLFILKNLGWNVTYYESKKYFVVTSVGDLGTLNETLYLGYILSGVACVIFGVCLLIYYII